MLAIQAERLEKRAKAQDLRGIFDWLTILTSLLPLLSMCKQPVDPAPPNPTPNATPKQADAWAKAWHLKSAAVDNWDGDSYRPSVVTRTAAEIRKSNRRDGKRMTVRESKAAALLALDDARSASMPELYGNVMEAMNS